MADEVRDVYQKVSFLHTHLCPRRVAGMGESRGLKPMCMLLARYLSDNVARKTVSDQIAAGKLASKFQEAIAGVFGFRVDAQQWQTGSAADFREWYLALHSASSAATIVPKLETGIGLKAIRIAETPPFDSQLASIDFSPRQSGPDQPWPVDISLCCQPALVEGVRLAVKCGRIRIDAGGARTGSITERADYLKSVTFRGSHGPIEVQAGGNERNPSWELDAGEQCIGIVRTCSEDFFFCKLYDLTHGAVITVHFTVYFKDLEVIETGDGEAHGGWGPFGSLTFARPSDEAKFSVVKNRIFKRLAELQLPNGDQGWAELCRDGRVFKRIASESKV